MFISFPVDEKKRTKEKSCQNDLCLCPHPQANNTRSILAGLPALRIQKNQLSESDYCRMNDLIRNAKY